MVSSPPPTLNNAGPERSKNVQFLNNAHRPDPEPHTRSYHCSLATAQLEQPPCIHQSLQSTIAPHLQKRNGRRAVVLCSLAMYSDHDAWLLREGV